METQKLTPTIVYILSILGLLCCCFFGFGFILAGIAFFIANSKLKEAKINPENYERGSISAMNTAKIFAIVVLGINILYFIYCMYMVSTIGWDELMKQSQIMMENWPNQ